MLCSHAACVYYEKSDVTSGLANIEIVLGIRKAELPSNDLECANTLGNQGFLLRAMRRYDEALASWTKAK